jgi:transposase InsO family protein
MLTPEEFDNWCRSVGLSPQVRELIQKIRLSQPTRRVRSGARNVCGRYPSRKMQRIIQFESHRNELAYICKLEHEPAVMEYYDQPSQIELNYFSKTQRPVRVLHTPDFFVIRLTSAGWEECKTELELVQKSQSSPNRFEQTQQGQWRCPPGERFASSLNLYYAIRSDAELNSTFQRNFVWLEDYWHSNNINIDSTVVADVCALIEAHRGITITQLVQQLEGIKIDDLNSLIATNQVYVDLEAAPLSCPDQVQVFLSAEDAVTYATAVALAEASAPIMQSINIAAGMSINWDGNIWLILNFGEKCVALLGLDNQFQEIPTHVFEVLVQTGRVVELSANVNKTVNETEQRLRHASLTDLRIATARYSQIEPFLNKTTLTLPSPTQRRWISQYRQAERTCNRGYLGLLPCHQDKGNYLPKMSEQVHQMMRTHIETEYETLIQPSIRQTYQSFKQVCEEHYLQPPSLETYRQEINTRPRAEQLKKRKGSRVAYQESISYWQLHGQETPIHGERPFEIAHIDHTQADVELLSETMLNLGINSTELLKIANFGRPWVTLLIDAYSRRILAVYMTFEAPSYRSDMMVLRLCVQRYGRLPQIIIVDGGKDFESTDFEVLLAYFQVTKKQRPAAKPRFGSIIESFFGVADKEFWHNLAGNTQIMRNVRQVTKSINPKNHAVWTLSKLYQYFCEYCYEIYDTSPHPALRMSPSEAFNIGISRGGMRNHVLVSMDEFKRLSMPSPAGHKGTRLVTRKGIKLHYLYYWHSCFAQILNTRVDVKYDPFDITIAYAYANGEWVECHSEYLQELQGCSEHGLMLAAAELKKLNQIQPKQFESITGRKLAQFFLRIRQEEAILTPNWKQAKQLVQSQQLRDTELRQLHTYLDEEAIGSRFKNLPTEFFDTMNNDVQTVTTPEDLEFNQECEANEEFEPLPEW